MQDAAVAKEAMAQELALLQNQLSAAQSARASAEAQVHELTEALAKERDRAFKADCVISDLQAKLSTMDELEQELRAYKTASEQSKKAGGLWGYISGA
jgi:chromosome segregation ATPase